MVVTITHLDLKNMRISFFCSCSGVEEGRCVSFWICTCFLHFCLSASLPCFCPMWTPFYYTSFSPLFLFHQSFLELLIILFLSNSSPGMCFLFFVSVVTSAISGRRNTNTPSAMLVTDHGVRTEMLCLCRRKSTCQTNALVL